MEAGWEFRPNFSTEAARLAYERVRLSNPADKDPNRFKKESYTSSSMHDEVKRRILRGPLNKQTDSY